MEQRILPPGSQLTRSEPVVLGGSVDPGYVSAPMPGVAGVPGNISLADYWRILLKRKLTVVVTLALVVILTTVYTLRTTPIYEAVGRINIGHNNAEFLQFKEAQPNEDDYTVSMETQVRILQSDSLALAVINKLGLNRAAAPPSNGAPLQAQPDSAAATAQIAAFKANLRVLTVPSTRVMEIHYRSPDPRLAANVVNAVVDTYIERNIKTKFESTMQAADWLSKQLADLQVKVESSQEQLVRYQREHEIIGGDEKTNVVTAKLSELNQELSQAEADRIHKQALYQFASSGNIDKIFSDEKATGLLPRMLGEQADLRNQYAQASVQFGPNHPKLVEMKARLDQLQTEIQAETQKSVARMQNDYLAALQREKMLRAAFEKQKQEANQLNQSAIEYNLLKREADANRQLYDGLLQKLKEAGISAGLNSTNVQVVDPARTPLRPAQPNIPRNLEFGLLFGLAMGVALAFTFEALDNTINTPEQIENYAGLSSLGLIPLGSTLRSVAGGRPKLLSAWSHSHRNTAIDLITYSRPKSELAEAYRALRTSILLASAGSPPKVILVTSPLPQEGKTTTSVNSAMALAQQGRRVLLVDADLRRPGIHRIFGIKPRTGLSDVLAGRQRVDSAVLQSPQTSMLSILPAGALPPQPSELLSSDVMKQLIARWSQEYDQVIIDSPPTLTVTDAVLLSVEVDRVILVIRAGHTTKTALRRSRDLLSHVNAKVLGVVINGVDLRSPDHYYYYYSGTKYYSGYYHE